MRPEARLAILLGAAKAGDFKPHRFRKSGKYAPWIRCSHCLKSIFRVLFIAHVKKHHDRQYVDQYTRSTKSWSKGGNNKIRPKLHYGRGGPDGNGK